MNSISDKDRNILRQLAEKQAEIAALPVHPHTIAGWKRMNSLQKGKPMVYIWSNHIPWHEMGSDGELTLETTDPFCRQVEEQLRRTIYQWQHMPCDMVVEPVFYCSLVINDTGFGITEQADHLKTDERSNIVSRKFHTQIREEKDIEKIRMPVITYDAEGTERKYQLLNDTLGDILHVEKRLVVKWLCDAWDQLVHWMGVEESLLAMAEQPTFVHMVFDRLVSAYISRLDQYEALNLLALNNDSTHTGHGGFGYTDELPGPHYDPRHIRSHNLWGGGQSQIMGSVSPRMHEEFAVKHERRFLERFGLTYYGCCDALDTKIGVLKSIPNLRKVSMSFVNIERAVKSVGDRYVFSYKPNPAIFASDAWNPQEVQRDLKETLEKTRGCVVEVGLRNMSTVRYQPQRLWEWARIAAEVTETFA